MMDGKSYYKHIEIYINEITIQELGQESNTLFDHVIKMAGLNPDEHRVTSATLIRCG